MSFRLTRAPGKDSSAGGADDTAVPAEKLAVGVPLSPFIPRQLADVPDIVVRGPAHSVAAERFRRLKTLLEHDEEGAPAVILVTSATPKEGKSLVAINLALAFALDRESKTLLIDCDLRRPSVDRWIVPAPSLGIAETLSGKADLEHVILRLKDTQLEVLPAGHPPPDPIGLLTSESFRALMTTLRQQYRRVIIDTPPIVPFTDADVAGRCADGVLLVVRRGQTLRPLYQQAVSAVTSTRILGVVLNDVVFNLADRDRHYGRYYEGYYDKGRNS
jgi:capsular exopolysaccharide synthesis family protein